MLGTKPIHLLNVSLASSLSFSLSALTSSSMTQWFVCDSMLRFTNKDDLLRTMLSIAPKVTIILHWADHQAVKRIISWEDLILSSRTLFDLHWVPESIGLWFRKMKVGTTNATFASEYSTHSTWLLAMSLKEKLLSEREKPSVVLAGRSYTEERTTATRLIFRCQYRNSQGNQQIGVHDLINAFSSFAQARCHTNWSTEASLSLNQHLTTTFYIRVEFLSSNYKIKWKGVPQQVINNLLSIAFPQKI